MKVSVIIPAYNIEDYIGRCLESIIKQTLKDIEIIVVNDGSNDNTLAIINVFARKDNRIKIVDKKIKDLSRRENQDLKWLMVNLFYLLMAMIGLKMIV